MSNHWMPGTRVGQVDYFAFMGEDAGRGAINIKRRSKLVIRGKS